MTGAYIYDAARTPRGRGRPNGALHAVPPVELAVQVLRALAARNRLDEAPVDDVALGVVTPVGEQGGDIARLAALRAYGQAVPGVQIDRFCSSGLDAVNLIAGQVLAGQVDIGIGGGVESMSRVPMGTNGGAIFDAAVARRMHIVPQGIAADLLATRSGFTRRDVDDYALASQQRAARAWSEGRFARSIVPVVGDRGETLLARDEHPRPGTTAADLAQLEPSFARIGEQAGWDALALERYPDTPRIDHVHTAGNSSGVVDGAAGALVGSAEAGRARGLTPRARIRSWASVGSEPTIMLTGPEPASRKALQRAGMSARDIDLFEVNEAFAAVVLEFMSKLGVPHERVNVNGGAIALGHPLGASGAMLLGTALDELERTGNGTALITLCVGLGMGTATIIERV